MAQRPGYMPQDGYFVNSPLHNGRMIPERCKSQFISQSYQVSVDQASEPLDIKKLPEISEFLSSDELSLLGSTNFEELNPSTQNIISNLHESEEINRNIAQDLNNLSINLTTNHFLAVVPEFQPDFMRLEDTKAHINVSKKFYKIPSSQIYDEIPTMFS